jgi:hypothetical protein
MLIVIKNGISSRKWSFKHSKDSCHPTGETKGLQNY